MQDRVPTPGQEGRVLITPENGSPYYAKIAMADNPTQAGTPLNKSNLLKDVTAALYGLPNTAVPDDVLAKLANAAFVENGGLTDVGGNSVGIQIATGSYVGTGLSGESNSNELTFDFAPKFCVVTCQDDMGVLLVAISPSPNASTYRNSEYEVTVTWNGNSMSWYYQKTGYGPRQCNSDGHTYNYIALG